MQFTKEQVKFLKEKFNIDISDKFYKIKDGYVSKGAIFYWLSEGGPEQVADEDFEEHLYNILRYPDLYQIKYPKFEVTYI